MTREEADSLEERQPLIDFEPPADPLCDRVADHFRNRYGDNLPEADTRWLSGLVADFLQEEPSLVRRDDFRLVAERFTQVLVVIDREMSRYRTSRSWKQVALAFGLPSALERGYTQAKIGAEFVSKRADTRGKSLSKMAIGNRMRRLAAAVGLQPAFKQSGQFRNL